MSFGLVANPDFEVQVVRQPTFTGDVSLSVVGLPPRVRALPRLPLSIPGTESRTSLSFFPEEFAAYGRFTIQLVGSGNGEQVERSMTLDIRPGKAALDSSFGTGGIAMPALGHPAVKINAMAVQPDGKWVLVGSTGSAGLRDVLVARLLADGTPDTSFGTQGVVVTDVCGEDDYVDAVTVLSDGRILVAGASIAGTNDCVGTLYQGALFARYTASGAPDTTFGGTGIRTFRIVQGLAALHAVTVDSNGRVVGAGTVNAADQDLLVIRLTPTGALDTTFSDNGVASADQGDDEDGLAVVIQADGKIVVAGASDDPRNNLAIVRFNASGTEDASFSFFASFTSPDIRPRTLHLLANGRLLLTGRATYSDGRYKAALLRVTSSGDEDSSFGQGGLATFDSGVSSFNDAVVGAGLLPGGEIVLATTSRTAAGAPELGVIHVSADGKSSLRAYGTNFPGEEAPTVAVLDADGFLRVGGLYTPEGQSVPVPFVTRYWPY